MLKILSFINIILLLMSNAFAKNIDSRSVDLTDSNIKTLNKIIDKNTKNNIKNKNRNISILHGDFKKKSDPSDKKDNTSEKKNKDFELTINKNSAKNFELETLLYDAHLANENGHIEIAKFLYKKILSKNPDNYYALFSLATIYYNEKESDLARILYTKILNKKPDDIEALNNFLIISGEESPYETINELKKFEILRPDDSFIPAQIASIYSRINDYDKSVKYLIKSIIIEPDNINYRYNLAVTYDRIGNLDNAIYVYKQILRANIMNQSFNYKIINDRINYLLNKI